jgi:hypothetical protein
VSVAAALLSSGRERQGDAGETWARRLVLPATALLILACTLQVAANGYGSGYPTRRIGFGVNRAEKPVGACEFIDSVGLGGNIFNAYEFGAYMIWRWQGLRKVFAHGFVGDPRYLMEEYAAIDRSASDFARIVERHKIDAFLLRSVRPADPASLPLSQRILLADRRWRLVYADDVAALFIRDMPENRGIIERYAVRPGGPGNNSSRRAVGR